MEHSWFATHLLRRKDHLLQRRSETTKVTISKPYGIVFQFLMNQVTLGVGFLIKVKFFLLFNFDILLDRDPTSFGMENSKMGFLPLRHGIHLSKGQSHKTPEEKEFMSEKTYALVIGSLMYAMLCIG